MSTTTIYLPDAQQRATQLAQQLTSGLLATDSAASPFSQVVHGQSSLLADVEFAIEELNSLLWTAQQSGFSIACLAVDGDTVPVVSIPKIAPLGAMPQPLPSSPKEAYSKLINPLLACVPSAVTWLQASDIPSMIVSPLSKFLTVRLQWIEDNPQFMSVGAASAQNINPYLSFAVHSQTAGLRIHYSKTFALNFNSVFGAPTTPLSGWILPGIHKFAGMDKAGNFYYDQGTFTTPPDFTASLLI